MNEINKHGQSIGRKGAESRRRLMDATRALIAVDPAHKISPSAIARAAGLASQTFYLYFKDMDEILLALSNEAGEDLQDVHDALGATWDAASPAEQAKSFIDAFSAYWERHRAILTVRNYLADSAHPEFVALRQATAMPLINAIANRMLAAHPDDLNPKSAFARSVVIYSAIERMAARPATMRHSPGILSAQDLQQAEADILALLFTPANVLLGERRRLAANQA
ncbi:MAG: TetR/AcrR family transcriptional regulator [Pseudomonadota bacterium]